MSARQITLRGWHRSRSLASGKRELGRYYTAGNPFTHPAFLRWAQAARLPNARILEPFAGANHLIHHLQSMGLCCSFTSYDITPANPRVQQRDTLADFPTNYDVCVTNPPWLAKNSATARGLPFPPSKHDDLYKVALERCLEHCAWVAALIPESFIRADIYQDRLQEFVSLTANMFEDTGHPVGLALFGPKSVADVQTWSGFEKIGSLASLQKCAQRRCRMGRKCASTSSLET